MNGLAGLGNGAGNGGRCVGHVLRQNLIRLDEYPDGNMEETFAKDGFTFSPGLILLGNDEGILTATF